MDEVGAVQRLKIAIDPFLKAQYGPEIGWTWRLLLSGIGFPWEEVSLGSPECDIAYVATPEQARHCRLWVCADPHSWAHRSHYRLGTVGRCDGWAHPIYDGQPPHPRPFQFVDGRALCERDLIFDSFWLVTGQEEAHRARNQHGYVDLSGTAFQREQALRLALASSIGVGLHKALASLGCAAPVPRWPYGKQAAACVGHDVDYPEVIRWVEPLRIIGRQGPRGIRTAASVLLGQRHHWHFASWMRMEQRLNTRSAFYFTARQGSLLAYALGTPDPFYDVRSKAFRDLFRILADAGFEIGLHASYHAYRSQERFAAEKRTLEEASGQTVYGNRHHYWHLDPANPEATLLLHEQIGLKYDTSLIHDRYIGWRRGLSWPFFPFHQQERRELKTLQIPTAWMDDQLFGQRVHNPGDRQAILRALADTTAEQGGCLLIDVHDYVYDEVLFPGWARAYRELWEYLGARADFWIDTPGRIADHWIARYSALTQASQGLAEGREPCENSGVRSRVPLPTVPEKVSA